MLAINLLLTFSTLTSLILALLIIASNNKQRTNQSLFVFLGGVFLWLLTNLLTNISPEPSIALFFAKSTMIGAVIMPVAFLIFTAVFTKRSFSPKKKILLFLPIVPLLLTIHSSLNIKSIDSYGQNTQTGAIYLYLTPLLLLYFTLGIINLIRHYRRTSSFKEQAQIRYMFIGIVLTLIPSILANAILPALGNTDAILYGPNAVIFLATFMSVAIIRHGFLDIRLIVARTVAYILSLGGIIIVYGTLLLLTSATIFQGSDINFTRQFFYAFMAIVAGIVAQPLKKYFDKLTNKLFYQDAYDPQYFLDQLNKELVSNVDVESLLSKCATIIDTNLKSSYCLFGLKETAYSPQRIIGSDSHVAGFDQNDINFARSVTPSMNKIVIIADDLREDDPLKAMLRKYDIAVLARLAREVSLETEGLGYAIFGSKKSGNPYTKQDKNMIEIIANELVIAIQNALRFEEIEKFNITLQDKVDAATAELQRTNEKLQQMDETKDEFISMASHQLRTPLTSVKGYLSMVLEGDVGKVNKKQDRMLEQAFLSSQRMVYLIADLLNVSRLKTGKFVIDSKETNLADVVETEIEQLKPTAKARDLTLEYKKPKKFPILTLDETKIRQVIMNFVDNAIYYTPAGGKIEVFLEDKGKTIEYRVKDNGIGVPKSERHNLFNKFYRAGNARKARPDGTGLGLFMAKKVVVAQGGAIIFETEEGKGSTFGFSFAKSELEKIAQQKNTQNS